MKIEWNKVNPLSELVAIVLAAIILLLGIYLGMQYQKVLDQNDIIDLTTLQNKHDFGLEKLKTTPTMTPTKMMITVTTTPSVTKAMTATVTPSVATTKTTTPTPTK